MAVTFLGDGRGFRNWVRDSSTGFPSSTTNLTIAFWVRYDAALSVSMRAVYDLSDGWIEGQPAWWCGQSASDVVFFEAFNGDSAWEATDYVDLVFGTLGSTLIVGQWYHLCYVKSGTSHTLYRDAASVATETLTQPANSNSWADGYELLGVPTGGQGEWSTSQFRLWTAALTESEVVAERLSATPVKTESLFRAVSFLTVSGTDTSGEGHHLTVISGGGMTTDTDPSAASSSASLSASASVSPSGSESMSASMSISPSTSLSPSISASASAEPGDDAYTGWEQRVRANTYTSASGGATLVVNQMNQTPIQADDVLMLFVTHKGAGWATFPAGWIVLDQQVNGTQRLEWAWKRATGSEPSSYIITGMATIGSKAILTGYGGGAAGDIVHALGRQVGGAWNFDAYHKVFFDEGLVTTIPNTLIVVVVCRPAAWSGVGLDLTNVDTVPGDPHHPPDENIGTIGIEKIVSTSASSLCFYEWIHSQEGPTGGLSAWAAFFGTQDHIVMMGAFVPGTHTNGAGSRYYLTSDSPNVRLIDTWKGTWDSGLASVNNFTPWGEFLWQISRNKSAGGIGHEWLLTRNNPDACNVLLGWWVTPPLRGQTLAGTLDVMLRAWMDPHDAFPHVPTPNHTIQYVVHAYVTQGNTLDTRTVLADTWVDPVTWDVDSVYDGGLYEDNNHYFINRVFEKFRALSTPIDISGVSVLDGDRIVMEVGVRLTPAGPYPPDILKPPKRYVSVGFTTGVTRDKETSSITSPPYVPLSDAVAGTSVTSFCPFIEFSAPLDERVPDGAIPTNTTPETAVVITDVPYATALLDTTEIAAPMRQLWYQWTAPAAMRVFAHTFGSSRATLIDVYDDVEALTTTSGWLESEDKTVLRSLSSFAWDADAATTYFIRIASGHHNYEWNTRSGGVIQFSLIREIPLANNDVLIGSHGRVVRYTSSGEMAAIKISGGLVSGLAIDTSGVSVEDTDVEPMASHTAPRLLVGVFTDGGYVGLFDLATLNIGRGFLDAFYNSINHADWDEARWQRTASLACATDGTFYISQFGDGFQLIADGGSAFLDRASVPARSAVWTSLVSHGDNATGAPWPLGRATTLTVQVGGTNYIELTPDQTEIYYTSGSWYRPTGVSDTIFRFDPINNVQLAPFATGIPTGPGPNPGLKGVFPLPLTPTTPTGGCLVCNGSAVLRLGPTGVVTHTYTFTPAANATTLVDVELQSDGAFFWTFNQGSGTLFKSSMETGLQTLAVSTWLHGAATSLVIYRADDYPEPPSEGGGGEGPRIRLIRRLRQSPHLTDEQTWLFFSSFQLDLETGRGATTGQGRDPQIMLQWSNDGGHTWSDEAWVSAGLQGQYTWRALWGRLGKSRDRAWRITMTDPVCWHVLDAMVDVTRGVS